MNSRFNAFMKWGRVTSSDNTRHNPFQNKKRTTLYPSSSLTERGATTSGLTLFQMFLYAFVTIHILFLIFFIYFKYIHHVHSAYELHFKPSTPHEFLSREYDFLHHRDAKKVWRRSKRFPNVEERLQIYMSNWYIPPCHVQNRFGLEVDERIGYAYTEIKDGEQTRGIEESVNNHEVMFSTSDDEAMMYAIVETKVLFDTPFVLQHNFLQSCVESDKRVDMEKQYCEDALHIINLLKTLTIDMEKKDASSTTTTISKVNASKITDWDGTSHSIPIIMNFWSHHQKKKQSNDNVLYSELKNSPVPYFQEFRSSSMNPKSDLRALSHKSDLDCSLPGLRKHLHTVEEEETHGERASYAPIVWFLNTKAQFKDIESVITVDIPWSWKINKAIVLNVDDMKFTFKGNFTENIPIHLENELLVGELEQRKRIEEVLKFKIIIIPSTNSLESMEMLKWALYSRSIVVMPPPKITTFAMEEILEPFGHYVPLSHKKTTLSNMNEQVFWVLKNDKKARKISEKGTLFIHDLFFHEDAYAENLQIQTQILNKYSSFFVNNAGS